MSNFKKITEVPVAESTENINLIANSNGAAVQVPANQIGAQADWNETDESSPAFIMNKPTSLGGEVVTYYISSGKISDLDLNEIPWETFVDKFNSGVVRIKNGLNYGTVVGYYASDGGRDVYAVMFGENRSYTIEF